MNWAQITESLNTVTLSTRGHKFKWTARENRKEHKNWSLLRKEKHTNQRNRNKVNRNRHNKSFQLMQLYGQSVVCENYLFCESQQQVSLKNCINHNSFLAFSFTHLPSITSYLRVGIRAALHMLHKVWQRQQEKKINKVHFAVRPRYKQMNIEMSRACKQNNSKPSHLNWYSPSMRKPTFIQRAKLITFWLSSLWRKEIGILSSTSEKSSTVEFEWIKPFNLLHKLQYSMRN